MPDLPIHDLIPPANDREFRDPEVLNRMTASMEVKGVLQPIRVTKEGNKYRVILGWTRVLCARRAGLTHIPAVVVDAAPDEADDLMEKVIENDCRGDTNPLDRARWYVKIMQLRGWSQAELARQLGSSAADVSKTLAISSKLPADLQERVASGDLCPAVAYLLTRLPDPVQMRDLAEKAMKGLLKRDSVEAAVVKLLGGKPRKAERPVKARTGKGLLAMLPPLDYDGVLGELATLTEAVRKAQKLGLPMSTLPQLLRG